MLRTRSYSVLHSLGRPTATPDARTRFSETELAITRLPGLVLSHLMCSAALDLCYTSVWTLPAYRYASYCVIGDSGLAAFTCILHIIIHAPTQSRNACATPRSYGKTSLVLYTSPLYTPSRLRHMREKHDPQRSAKRRMQTSPASMKTWTFTFGRKHLHNTTMVYGKLPLLQRAAYRSVHGHILQTV